MPRQALQPARVRRRQQHAHPAELVVEATVVPVLPRHRRGLVAQLVGQLFEQLHPLARTLGNATWGSAGLALVDELAESGRLDGYYLLPATRADLLRRACRFAEATAAYEEALRLAPTDAERRYLAGRLREL